MMYSKYFENDLETLAKLEQLHQRKYALKEELSLVALDKPFVVEFSGLPRTGKSTSTEKVYAFFKQANFQIDKTKEPAQIIKEMLTNEQLKSMSNLDFNNKTLEISREELSKKLESNSDIIIQDRGVIDNYFWYQMMYDEGTIDSLFYNNVIKSLSQDIMDTDQIFIMLANPEIIIYRDYINQIYLEDRTKTTIDRVKKLREGFDHLLPLIQKMFASDKLILLDTSNINEIELSITIADKIMDGMSKKLILK